MKKLLNCIAPALLFIASGCFSSSTPSLSEGSLPTSQSEVVETQKTAPAKSQQGIEIAWKVPSEPVDGYVIRYGATPDSLQNEVRVSIIEIREEQDPELGPVFRYLIRGVQGSKRLFVSIAAFKGDVVSNFSDVLEVQ